MVNLRTAGLEQAKNLAGGSSPPGSNSFNDTESAENRASLSRQFAAAVNPLIRVPEKPSASHWSAQRNVSRHRNVASAIQIVRCLALLDLGKESC